MLAFIGYFTAPVVLCNGNLDLFVSGFMYFLRVSVLICHFDAYSWKVVIFFAKFLMELIDFDRWKTLLLYGKTTSNNTKLNPKKYFTHQII